MVPIIDLLLIRLLTRAILEILKWCGLIDMKRRDFPKPKKRERPGAATGKPVDFETRPPINTRHGDEPELEIPAPRISSATSIHPDLARALHPLASRTDK